VLILKGFRELAVYIGVNRKGVGLPKDFEGLRGGQTLVAHGAYFAKGTAA